MVRAPRLTYVPASACNENFKLHKYRMVIAYVFLLQTQLKMLSFAVLGCQIV